MGAEVNASGNAAAFEPERLMSEALAAAGRHDDVAAFGSDDFVEPLQVACQALDGEAQLHDLGRWATHRYLRRLLDVRIELADWVGREDPGVVDEVVESPVLVIGAPRTGTTAVHRLLAADPRLRAPEAWEFLRPVPPPEADSFDSDPRIAGVSDEVLFLQTQSGELRRIHTYSARMPKECLSAMSFSFRTEELVSRFHVPSYVEWLQACDMTPAYDMHRLVLQVLQRRMPGRRWALKSPVHLQSLGALTATYPDASFVVTHRRPAAVLASVSSLVATVRAAFSDHVDRVEIGRYHTDLYARSLDRLVDAVADGTLDPRRTVHLRHADVVADARSAVADVYSGLGLAADESTWTALQASAAAEREDGTGAHRVDPADFGIDARRLGDRFDRYVEHFLPA